MNLGPQDALLSLATLAIPAAGATNTTGVLDLEAVGPFSNAKHKGMIQITIPPLPNLVATFSVTGTVQVANASVIASNPAPGPNVPGAFFTPNPSQVFTITGVAGGYPGGTVYLQFPLDANGNTYQYLQFVQTSGAGAVTEGEIVTYAFVAA
jgi:hypothetical protein